MLPSLKIVIFGLSMTSSWGNGHATTYRGLVSGLASRGHDVVFFERDQPWYAANRDVPGPPFCRTVLYESFDELKDRFSKELVDAHFAIVGSYVQQGTVIGDWLIRNCAGAVAFYDIDTPVTMAKIENGEEEYLSRELIRRYDLYLSFTGGPILGKIESVYGSPMARPLYCSADPGYYRPGRRGLKWDMGYIGTYSRDRQSALEALMLRPARTMPGRKFVVAGPLYPEGVDWPGNVERIEHVPPSAHSAFYNSMDFTLNVTRADMVRCGYSPSVRLFEAAACATPVISDYWEGLEDFFEPGKEILLSGGTEDTMRILQCTAKDDLARIGSAARARLLAGHTPAHRAAQLEGYINEVLKRVEVTK